MQFGISLSNLSALPAKDAVANVFHVAQQAEEQGFDTVWVADHLAVPDTVDSPYPYGSGGRWRRRPDESLLEALTVLASLAGRTRRVRLGTGVLVLPYRHPLLTAKMTATIDVISGGRMLLGVGSGWMREEFLATGAPPFEERGAVLDEYIRVLRQLWQGRADPRQVLSA